jgi:hypothetical protein
MTKWALGVLALTAVGFTAALIRPRPQRAGCAECIAPPAFVPLPTPGPAPAVSPVVDVVDVAAELGRPVAAGPFVPFDAAPIPDSLR